jgi:HlyD family secretion protein
MKNRRHLLILAGLLVVSGTVAWLIRTHRTQVQHQDLVLYGNVDIREVNLGFRVSGRVAQIRRDEGDVVPQGEVLAKLDDEPYRRDLQEAQAQTESLRARLQLLQAGHRPEEIAQARALVREREVTAENAERVFKRQTELLTSKAVSIQDRDDAEARYREAAARLASAREQLTLLETGFRSEEIAQAKADLARAEALVATAALRLSDTELKAPAAGVVLTRAQEPGAVLQAGATVLTVSLTKPVWVRAYVQETDLGRIHPGQKVQLTTDSRPGHPYCGQIGYISPRAEFTPKNVETTELRTSLVYRLRVVVENPDEGLRQGMPTTVRVPRHE